MSRLNFVLICLFRNHFRGITINPHNRDTLAREVICLSSWICFAASIEGFAEYSGDHLDPKHNSCVVDACQFQCHWWGLLLVGWLCPVYRPWYIMKIIKMTHLATPEPSRELRPVLHVLHYNSSGTWHRCRDIQSLEMQPQSYMHTNPSICAQCHFLLKLRCLSTN